MNELYLYLFWFSHILCGALVDSKIWGKKEDDPRWTIVWTDLYWLGWVAWTPFLIAYLSGMGVEILSWKSLVIASGMSVVWDLVYTKMENGVWIVPLPYWLAIPFPFIKSDNPYDRRIIIGFYTKKSMLIFNIVRVIILILTVFI